MRREQRPAHHHLRRDRRHLQAARVDGAITFVPVEREITLLFQAGSTAVHDTVVNQLLSKMDGVDQLNNILVIGMTNRKDMIDEALLRPGRMEVQMEISLPDEAGRLQILKIHTARMRSVSPQIETVKSSVPHPFLASTENSTRM